MLFGRGGALGGTFSWGAGCPQGFFFFRALKLIFINLGGKNEIPLGVPPTPNKGTTTCPAPPKQHSGPLFGPTSLRKMWRVSFVLIHAISGELWHSSGEIFKICAKLRGAGFWVTMCFYGHVKSRYTFWGHLGPFPQLRQISPELATSSGNRILLQVNRITGQVLVLQPWRLWSQCCLLATRPGYKATRHL